MLASEASVALESRSLEASYRACRTIVESHSKTFALSLRFLPPEKRRAVWAVYAFCRTADDIVDRVTPAHERLTAIDAWECRLRASYRGVAAGPVFVALSDAAQRFEIPLEPALDLLRGARMDVGIDRYESYAALQEYCYLVASTVGLLVTPVLGAESPAAREYAVALGRAMQMTNILRDVGEDARMGRIYLPGEDLRAFGCREDDIFAGRVSASFGALMRFEIARVRALYREAEPGIALLSPKSRYTVRLALALYRGILNRIEANRFDVFRRRAHVPLRGKLRTALSLALVR